MTIQEYKNLHENESYIGFWGEIVKETEKAFLVKTKFNLLYNNNISWDNTSRLPIWIAKSIIKDTVTHWQGKLVMFLTDKYPAFNIQYSPDCPNDKYVLVPAYYNNLNAFKNN